MQTYAVYWQQTTEILGWTFLHFLWQGALIALLYAVLRNFSARPTRRYTLGIVALFVMALAPAITAYRIWQQLPEHSLVASLSSHQDSLPVVNASSDFAQAASSVSVNNVLPWLGALWLCGVLLLSLNSVRHWRRMHWLLHHDAAPVPEWQYELLRLCDRFAIWPRVRLLQSSHVLTPTLIGWLKPIILLPVSVLAGFTPQQIEMIIAHELGHVRRWDYLLNLFQVALETILFYHPAVHWISRDVRNVRETCCDDLVIELGCGTPLAYAHTLANLEGLRADLPAPALAASGGILLARVRRIVGVPHEAPDAPQMRQHAWLLSLFLLMAIGMGIRFSSHSQSVSADTISAIQFAPTRMLQQAYAMLARVSVNPVRSTVPVATPASVAPTPIQQKETIAAHSAAESVAHPAEPLIVSQIGKPRLTDAIEVKSALQVSNIGLKSSPLRSSDLIEPIAATMPKLVRRIAPSYPASALEKRQQGHVSLSFAIASDGAVQNIELVSADAGEPFVAAATEALHQWKFEAGSRSGSNERYTQVFDFSVGKTAGAVLVDEAACKLNTGSHICRRDIR